MSTKRGRPPFPPGVARSVVLSVRLSPAEFYECKEASRAAGKPLAAWCRTLLVTAARCLPRP